MLVDRLRSAGIDPLLEQVEAPRIWLAEPFQGVVPVHSLKRIQAWIGRGE